MDDQPAFFIAYLVLEAITALRERVKERIDEKVTAGRLPKAHRWERPPTHREAV
jgi:hypothetical protein